MKNRFYFYTERIKLLKSKSGNGKEEKYEVIEVVGDDVIDA